MAYYRVLRTGTVQGTLYRAGQIVDLGDDAFAGVVNAALRGGLLRLAAPEMVDETVTDGEATPMDTGGGQVEVVRVTARKARRGKR